MPAKGLAALPASGVRLGPFCQRMHARVEKELSPFSKCVSARCCPHVPPAPPAPNRNARGAPDLTVSTLTCTRQNVTNLLSSETALPLFQVN